jgi:AraC family transcriptional regulator
MEKWRGRMKTRISFHDANTQKPAESADPGVIVASSAGLGWRGAHVERGYNSHFTPDNVVVPDHYFALLTSHDFSWEWKDGKKFRRHTMRNGQIWINPAGVPFSHRIVEYSEFVLLTLDPGAIANAAGDDRLVSRVEFHRRHNMEDPRLRGLILSLIREAESGGMMGPLFVESLVVELAVHFLRQYAVQIVPLGGEAGLSGQRLRRCLDYIHSGSDTLTIEAIAKEAGMSQYHFIRAFRRVMRVTPHQYVLQCRLAKAREDIERGNAPISQIASELGFSDQSHFGRLFKRRYGVTPGHFARTLRAVALNRRVLG